MSDTARCPSCGGAARPDGRGMPRLRLCGARRDVAPRHGSGRGAQQPLFFVGRRGRRRGRRRRGGLGALGAQPTAPRERAVGGLGAARAGLGRRACDPLVGAFHHAHDAQRHDDRGARRAGRRYVARAPAGHPGRGQRRPSRRLRRYGRRLVAHRRAGLRRRHACRRLANGRRGDAHGARRVRAPHRGGGASARAGARAAPCAQRSSHVGRRSGGRVRPGPRVRLPYRFGDLRRRSARPRAGHAPSTGTPTWAPRRSGSPHRPDQRRRRGRRGGTTRSPRRPRRRRRRRRGRRGGAPRGRAACGSPRSSWRW